MGVNDTEKRILALAEECIRLGKQELPEKQWIGRMYERFRAANGMPGKAETDGLIFRKMYGNAPEKASDTLKIRYWRTGRHLPGSREQCMAFGRALELSADETQYLIQGYYDRCDRVFETEEPDAVYLERIRLPGQTLHMNGKRYCLFYCVPSRIPLHSHWRKGVRSMNKGECEYLFTNSFYSISGAMGALGNEIRTVASVRQPVMIIGETGTGKEQIARYLYLQGPLVNNPFVLVNCELMNDRSWESLFNHDNSPLNAIDTTIYFQNFELIPEGRLPELLAAIQETGLSRRVRLIFSCVCREGDGLPERIRRFISRLGCLTLHLPSLRSRSDEIPSLASLYLSSLKLELGKQISGFEPRAMEMLCQYDWPNNYTQFKHILQTLATMTDSTYIRSSAVAELLTKERSRHRRSVPAAAAVNTDWTLDEMIREVIQQAVASNNGNRAAAARQLGISRTTLWRYLSRKEGGEGES